MLLKQYKAQFRGAPLGSTYSFLKQIVLGSLPNNPLVTHETDVRHLRNPSFLAAALEYRWDAGGIVVALQLSSGRGHARHSQHFLFREPVGRVGRTCRHGTRFGRVCQGRHGPRLVGGVGRLNRMYGFQDWTATLAVATDGCGRGSQDYGDSHGRARLVADGLVDDWLSSSKVLIWPLCPLPV